MKRVENTVQEGCIKLNHPCLQYASY